MVGGAKSVVSALCRHAYLFTTALFAYAKEQYNMCALSGTADTNGQTFFQSREKAHLYLNEPTNLAFLLIGGHSDSLSLVL